tara:strand:+ start:290 stop:601 length:312 start_codon:yes stop_codon:yes gene_type:complete
MSDPKNPSPSLEDRLKYVESIVEKEGYSIDDAISGLAGVMQLIVTTIGDFAHDLTELSATLMDDLGQLLLSVSPEANEEEETGDDGRPRLQVIQGGEDQGEDS